MWELIKGELTELVKAYGDKRRTKITGPVEEVVFSEEQYIVAEDSIVLVTREGWFKRQKSYTDLSAVRVREGDSVGWALPASTRETLMIFTSVGRVYTMRVADITQTTGYGEAIGTKFSWTDGEHVVGVATSDGRCLPVVSEAELAALGEGEPAPPYAVAMTGAAVAFASRWLALQSRRPSMVGSSCGPSRALPRTGDAGLGERWQGDGGGGDAEGSGAAICGGRDQRGGRRWQGCDGDEAG